MQALAGRLRGPCVHRKQAQHERLRVHRRSLQAGHSGKRGEASRSSARAPLEGVLRGGPGPGIQASIVCGHRLLKERKAEALPSLPSSMLCRAWTSTCQPRCAERRHAVPGQAPASCAVQHNTALQDKAPLCLHADCTSGRAQQGVGVAAAAAAAAAAAVGPRAAERSARTPQHSQVPQRGRTEQTVRAEARARAAHAGAGLQPPGAVSLQGLHSIRICAVETRGGRGDERGQHW